MSLTKSKTDNSSKTKKETKKLYKEMEKFYGEKLANPVHYPKSFAYQVKVYKYFQEETSSEK